MSESPRPRAIVAGHADFAAGMISAVQQITGRGDALRGISSFQVTGGDLVELMRSAVEESGVQVVFTDLQAGSCSMASRRLVRDRPDVVLIAGANLPMLLDFVMADGMSPVDAARHAVEKGRAAIATLGEKR